MRNLLSDIFAVMHLPLRSSHPTEKDQFYRLLRMEPRVQDILEHLEQASPNERERLKRMVLGQCDVYIRDLPLFQLSGEPWMPTVHGSGGGMALLPGIGLPVPGHRVRPPVRRGSVAGMPRSRNRLRSIDGCARSLTVSQDDAIVVVRHA